MKGFERAIHESSLQTAARGGYCTRIRTSPPNFKRDIRKNGNRVKPLWQPAAGHIVSIYRTIVGSGSAAEHLLLDSEPLITRNAAEDPLWRELGLQNYARAASLRESVLAPMRSDGNLVGCLQLSNHHGSASPFTGSEIELIKAVTDRATGIIENSFVVEKSRQKALRSDALRRIARLVVSDVPLDKVLCSCLGEIATLFQSNLGAIFLLDEQMGELRLHRESVYGVSKDSMDLLQRYCCRRFLLVR